MPSFFSVEQAIRAALDPDNEECQIGRVLGGLRLALNDFCMMDYNETDPVYKMIRAIECELYDRRDKIPARKRARELEEKRQELVNAITEVESELHYLKEGDAFTCNPCECGGSDLCDICNA